MITIPTVLSELTIPTSNCAKSRTSKCLPEWSFDAPTKFLFSSLARLTST